MSETDEKSYTLYVKSTETWVTEYAVTAPSEEDAKASIMVGLGAPCRESQSVTYRDFISRDEYLDTHKKSRRWGKEEDDGREDN